MGSRLVLASLVLPMVAFIATVALGAVALDRVSLDLSGSWTALPFLVLVTGGPALLVVAVSPDRLRLVALGAMSILAAVAGWLVASTDDAQAGLAVLVVPAVALPLAVVIATARVVHTVVASRAS